MFDVIIDVRVDCYSGKSAENEVHDAFYIEQRDQRLCILCIEELMHHSTRIRQNCVAIADRKALKAINWRQRTWFSPLEKLELSIWRERQALFDQYYLPKDVTNNQLSFLNLYANLI